MVREQLQNRKGQKNSPKKLSKIFQKPLDKSESLCYNTIRSAGMAELADALDSGSSRGNSVEVQVLLPAPNSRNPNPKPVGEGFGFLYVF